MSSISTLKNSQSTFYFHLAGQFCRITHIEQIWTLLHTPGVFLTTILARWITGVKSMLNNTYNSMYSTTLNTTLSSGACQDRRCRCHESPPCRSVLRASLCWRQGKIQWMQVGLHCSEPWLSGTTRPSSHNTTRSVWLSKNQAKMEQLEQARCHSQCQSNRMWIKMLITNKLDYSGTLVGVCRRIQWGSFRCCCGCRSVECNHQRMQDHQTDVMIMFPAGHSRMNAPLWNGWTPAC